MTKIENQAQYEWAVKRVEELLPLVKDDTPLNDPNSIELELLSNLVADYSEEHFALGEPTLVDVLTLIDYEMGLNQKSLAKLGSRPTSSHPPLSLRLEKSHSLRALRLRTHHCPVELPAAISFISPYRSHNGR